MTRTRTITTNIEALIEYCNIGVEDAPWSKKRVANWVGIAPASLSQRLTGHARWQEGELEMIAALFQLDDVDELQDPRLPVRLFR